MRHSSAAIIGQHNIFAQFGVTAPIAQALRSLEAATDSYASTLQGIAPSQANDIANSKAQLDIALSNAISTYEQICIPSPLYPTLQPICVGL
jgi:hypothetical protein